MRTFLRSAILFLLLPSLAFAQQIGVGAIIPGSGGGVGGTGGISGVGASTAGNVLLSGNTGAQLNSATDSGIPQTSVVTTTGAQTLSGPKTLSNPILTGTVAGSPLASGTWSFGSVQISPNLITGLPSPTNASDAVTKSYVDALTGTSTTWHSSVTVATAAVLPNSPTYSNGSSGVGATLTAGSNVALVVDGVTVSTLTTRVLVQNQASAFQNGIYTLTQAGTGSVPWILTRATDFNTVGAGSVATGAAVLATSGTVNTGLQFWMNQTAAITIGTTAITWVQIGGSGLVGGTGITISGGAINLNSTLPSALSIPSPAITGTPTIGGFTIGLGGNTTLPAAPGSTSCLHMSAAGAVTTASADCMPSIALGTGLTNALGTQNTGSLSATAATPNIYPQNWVNSYTSGHTVSLADGVQTYVANGSGAITFTIGNVASDGDAGVGYCFVDKSGHGFTLTIAEPASGTFYGGGAGSSFTAGAGKSAYVCTTSDGTNVALGVAYPAASSASGATGNPQYNAGGNFGADRGVFVVTAFGADPTGVADSTTDIQNAINAAKALTPCGVVYFPAGTYLINAATLTTDATPGCVFRGTGGYSYDADEGSTLVTTNASLGILLSINDACTGSNVQAGVTIEGITFDDNSGHNNTLLKLCNEMRVRVSGNSFRNGNYGTYVTSASASGHDDSDGTFAFNLYYKNNTGYYQADNTSSGTGQNQFGPGNYVLTNGAGSIGVFCDGGTDGADGSFVVEGNRFDGGGGNTLIKNTCFESSITHNRLEGGYNVAIQNSLAGGNAGKQVTVTGNLFNTSGGANNGTCTPVTTGTTWACSSTAGFVVGMELHGTGVPTFSMGAFSAGTNNTLNGGTYIVSIVANTSIVTTQVASSNPGSETVSACQTDYNIDHSGGTFGIVGNAYANAQGCQTVYGFVGQ